MFSPRPCFQCDEVDMQKVSREVLRDFREKCGDIPGPTGLGNWCKASALLAGAYFQVAKEVSTDMEVCRFEAAIDRDSFPAEAGTVCWEDPSLPAMTFSTDAKGVCLAIDNIEGWGTQFTCTHVLSFPYEKASNVLSGERLPYIGGPMPSDAPLSEEESEGMLYMVRLLFRVIAFATDKSRLAVAPCQTRNEKKAIGIHPKHDSFKFAASIRYLPHVRVEREREEAEVKADSERRNYTFKGRAGFVRWYKHERYVNMRGKSQVIWPIPAPEGYKVIYKIRKPYSNAQTTQKEAGSSQENAQGGT